MGKRDISVMIGGIFFLLFLFFVFFKPDLEDVSGSTSQENLLPQSELVLRFDFEPEQVSSVVTDLAGNHNGNINDILPIVGMDRYGEAFSFKGTTASSVLVGDAADIRGGQPLSVSFWVRLDDTTKAGSIVFKGNSQGSMDYNIYYDSTNNKFVCGTKSGTNKYEVSSSTLSSNAWHHVVCVIDKTSSKIGIYVDNNLYVSATQVAGAFVSTTDSLYTGYNSKVSIDSFRIYKKVLSSQDVTDLYNGPPSGVLGPLDSLISYWMMNEGSGLNIKDWVGGNAGTITGATWTSDTVHGNVLSFDGNDDYVSVPGFNLATNPPDKLSFAFWLNDGAGDNDQTFLSDAGQSGTSGFIAIQRNTGSLVYGYADGASPKSLYFTGFFSTTQASWKHVVITADYSTKEIKVYKDGNQVGAQTMSNSLAPDSDKLFIGAYSSAHASKLTGNIYDVRIYNRILSDNEIKSFNPGYTPLPRFPYGTIDLTNALVNVSNSLTGNVSFVVGNTGKKIDNNSLINLTISKTGFSSSKGMYVQEFMSKLGVQGTDYKSADYDLGNYLSAVGYDIGTYSLDILNFGLGLSGGGTYNLVMDFIVSNGNVYSKSKSLSVAAPPNRAPALIGVVPNQTWAKGSNKINALDLDAYFSDPDGDALNYSASGNPGSIVIGFNNDGTINLTQPANFTGIANIRFVASDGTLSNQSNLVKLEVNGNVTCVPAWVTGNWSSCSSAGFETRIVSDMNNCGVVTGKPAETESCTPSSTGGTDVSVDTGADTSGTGTGVSAKEKPGRERKESIFSSKIFLTGLVIFIFAGVVVGVYFVQRYRQRGIVVREEPGMEAEAAMKPEVKIGPGIKKPHVERKLKPVYEEPENIKEMKDYINGMMDKGGGMNDIKDALIKAGWDKTDVEHAADYVILERFARSKLKTMSKDDIKKLLIGKGWDSDMVESVLKSL